MKPRWKGKGFVDIANENPMSEIIKKLQISFIQSKEQAQLSGCEALFEAGPDLADLLGRTCFGQPITTSSEDKQWFQFGPEEAFYLSYILKCLKILGEDGQVVNCENLWDHMKFKKDNFPFLFKAYSHLRSKNWIVRPGHQYGVDYVAYRHHPALVHSEYSVLVVTKNHPRLKVWSDWQSVVRVTGGVAKNLLVLSIDANHHDVNPSLSYLDQYTVDERLITRWVPEHSRAENNHQK